MTSILKYDSKLVPFQMSCFWLGLHAWGAARSMHKLHLLCNDFFFCLAIEKCSRLVKFHGASFLFSLGASRKKAMKNGHDSRSWNELCRTLSEQNFWITSSWAVTEAKFLFFWHFYDMPSCLAFRSTVQQSSSLLKMCILVSLWNSFYRPSIGWLLLYRICRILDDPLGVLRIFPPH